MSRKIKRIGPMTAKQRAAAKWRAKQKALKIQMETGILPETQETDAEIETKLSERFGILKVLANAACNGEARALIVSGPAGISKSYTVEKTLEQWDPNETQYTAPAL